MGILPIKPKTFDSSYRELRLSELTFVSSYALLVLVTCRLYLRTMEEMIGDDWVVEPKRVEGHLIGVGSWLV